MMPATKAIDEIAAGSRAFSVKRTPATRSAVEIGVSRAFEDTPGRSKAAASSDDKSADVQFVSAGIPVSTTSRNAGADCTGNTEGTSESGGSKPREPW